MKNKQPVPINSGVSVVRPVVVQPKTITPPKENQSYHQVLERFLGPFGVIFTLSMAVKSSYFLTQGALDYTKLPDPIPVWITVITGVALAFSAEIVGIAAGNKSYRLSKARFDIMGNRKLPKQQREAMAKQARFDMRVNLAAAIIGFGVSTYALLDFASNHISKASNSDFAFEFMSAITLQFVAVYVGILFEPTRSDPFKAVISQAYSAVGSTVSAIAGRMQAGDATNKEIRMIQQALPVQDRGLLDTLLTSDGTTEMWDSTKIAHFLMDHAHWKQEKRDEMFATVQHNITNRLRRVQHDSEYGITPKEKGRGLVIPADKALYLFLAEIESATTNGTLFASSRKIKTFQVSPGQGQKGKQLESDRSQAAPENETITQNGAPDTSSVELAM